MYGATAPLARAAPVRAISTHAPYVRGDAAGFTRPSMTDLFQPTPRMYGATPSRLSRQWQAWHFNPRPVCTGRRSLVARISSPVLFNPRPVCTGRHTGSYKLEAKSVFQPTPRMYGATGKMLGCLVTLDISTHAPYVRGDRGGRGTRGAAKKFQPTPRMYGATLVFFCLRRRTEISTHAPYVRGDAFLPLHGGRGGDFNPRPVCTGRLMLRAYPRWM